MLLLLLREREREKECFAAITKINISILEHVITALNIKFALNTNYALENKLMVVFIFFLSSIIFHCCE